MVSHCNQNGNANELEDLAVKLSERYRKLPKRTANGFDTNCPCHSDEHGSLSLSVQDGTLLANCQAGCDKNAVWKAVSALRTEGRSRVGKAATQVKAYPYHDVGGKVVFEKVRYEPKAFKQRRPDGKGGWAWNLDGVDASIPYRLPEIQKAVQEGQRILVVEGEKDADNLAVLGFYATTNAQGASQNGKAPKWTDAHSKWLTGAQSVVVLADNDAAGQAHADAIAASLDRAGIPCKIVKLPGLPPKGDVSDWLAAGGTKNQLLEFVDRAQASKSHTPSSEWPAIIPLESATEAEPSAPYPLEALGTTLKQAAEVIQKSTQAPPVMCAQAVLAAAHLAYAGHFDVEIDGRVLPNTEYFITVGASGERKSATDNAALYPIREHEKSLRSRHKREIEEYELSQDVYRAERACILRKKDKAGLDNLNKPETPPPLPSLAVGDVTIEGLQLIFGQGNSRLGLFTSEAGQLIGGWSMGEENRLRTAASLSAFWDGRADTRARGTSGVTNLAGRRLVAHLGCQPNVAAQFLSATDLEGQGILARFLPAWPTSRIGERPYQSVDLHENEAYNAYCVRLSEILARPLPVVADRPGELNPPRLSLSVAAKQLWMRFHDAVEKDAGKGGALYSIQPFACKAAEHVLRVAGVLAMIGNDEEISIGAMKDAIALVRWYLDEWLRIRSAGRRSAENAIAIALLQWLRSKDYLYFTSQQIYQRGPTGLRSAPAANAAIGLLERHNYVRPASVQCDNKQLPGFEVRPDD